MVIRRKLTMVLVLTQCMLRRSPCGTAIRVESFYLKRQLQASLGIDAVQPCLARDEDQPYQAN